MKKTTINKKDLDYIFEVLKRDFFKDETELNYATPFQLLVAVILSAQTTDKQVNKVTARFFDTVKDPQDIIKIGHKKRETMINAVNFYKNKAKHIYETAKILSENKNKTPSSFNISIFPSFNNLSYTIPDTFEELVKLPGIGEKTAKVLLYVLFKKPVVAVDTHVHRVTNRLGLVTTNNPLKTSELLEKLLPLKYKKIAHHSIIYFGRYHCTARNPKCDVCPFIKFCVYYNSLKN